MPARPRPQEGASGSGFENAAGIGARAWRYLLLARGAFARAARAPHRRAAVNRARRALRPVACWHAGDGKARKGSRYPWDARSRSRPSKCAVRISTKVADTGRRETGSLDIRIGDPVSRVLLVLFFSYALACGSADARLNDRYPVTPPILPAAITACVRLSTPSLVKIAETCAFTVASDTESS